MRAAHKLLAITLGADGAVGGGGKLGTSFPQMNFRERRNCTKYEYQKQKLSSIMGQSVSIW
jgi:hypothetical protein